MNKEFLRPGLHLFLLKKVNEDQLKQLRNKPLDQRDKAYYAMRQQSEEIAASIRYTFKIMEN